MDWSRNGLLAYASHGVIVIVDCTTLSQIQTLDRDHKTSVTRLKWSKAWSKRHVAHEMMLASADASGRILIWNVKSGEVKTQLSEGMSIMITGFLWLFYPNCPSKSGSNNSFNFPLFLQFSCDLHQLNIF